MRPAWFRRFMIALLATATVAAVMTFGMSSVRTGIQQQSQINQAGSEADRLNERIAELTTEVDIRTSPSGVLREALCFGPYVEPGTEVYTVAGVSGCVTA